MIESRGTFLLDIDDPDKTTQYLDEQGWLHADETVQNIGRAGEGNMNCTLRVITNRRSFILKQSRAWVEKYPRIAAPEARLLVETAFYQAVDRIPEVASLMPALLTADRSNRIAMLEDLGNAADFTFLYNDKNSTLEILPGLCRWLVALHASEFSAEVKTDLQNRDMRLLNHEHLYNFPLLGDNQFDLDAITPGLQAAGDRLKRNEDYVKAITRLGELYLEDGTTLLHGDFFPGSWLDCPDGIRIIDPEFCFFGCAEYDVGILIAHLHLCARPQTLIDAVFQHYQPQQSFDRGLCLRFAGMELMRRLIGVAQLPLQANLERKKELLELSENLVLDSQN